MTPQREHQVLGAVMGGPGYRFGTYREPLDKACRPTELLTLMLESL